MNSLRESLSGLSYAAGLWMEIAAGDLWSRIGMAGGCGELNFIAKFFEWMYNQ